MPALPLFLLVLVVGGALVLRNSEGLLGSGRTSEAEVVAARKRASANSARMEGIKERRKDEAVNRLRDDARYSSAGYYTGIKKLDRKRAEEKEDES